MHEHQRFDEEAATWDDAPGHEERQVAVARAIEKAVSLNPEMRALDIGCGTGRLSILLADRVGSVVVTDPSAGMVQVAQERIEAAGLGDRLRAVRADLTTDLLDGAFDVAWSSMALHHVQDVDALLRSVAGLMVNGGRLAIADLDEDADGRLPRREGRLRRTPRLRQATPGRAVGPRRVRRGHGSWTPRPSSRATGSSACFSARRPRAPDPAEILSVRASRERALVAGSEHGAPVPSCCVDAAAGLCLCAQSQSILLTPGGIRARVGAVTHGPRSTVVQRGSRPATRVVFESRNFLSCALGLHPVRRCSAPRTHRSRESSCGAAPG